jgi:hypothetical protein
MARKKKGVSMFMLYYVISSLCRQMVLIHLVCISAMSCQIDHRYENQIQRSNKLNISHLVPSVTICHAKVFSKGLLEASSATKSVRKTWDLEWKAEYNIERNNLQQMHLKIDDLSSIKFPN